MEYNLKNLVDIPKLQKLTDELYSATSIPSSIVTMEGEILTGSGWQKICTDFHRKHPQVKKECMESDTRIRMKLEQGEPFVIYECPRGLVDASSPIVIDGEHVANIFSGQVLLKPRNTTLERFFRKQAKEFGFDETDYIKALFQVPVFTKEKFLSGISFLSGFAQIIVDMGLKKLNELKTLEAIQDSDSTVQALFNASKDSALILELDGTVVNLNEVMAKRIGKRPDDILGKYIDDFLSAPIAESRKKHLEKAILKGKPVYFEDERSGFAFDHTVYPIHDSQGKVYRVAIFVRDITERKQMEEKLHFLSSITEGVSDSIVVTNTDFEILYANKEAENLFGYTLKELEGNSPDILNAEPETEKIQQKLYKTIERGETFLGQSLNKRKDGSKFHCEYKVMPLKNVKNEVYAYVGIQRDISERKHTEEHLLQTQKMESIGSLAGGIAHDFNNILFPIIGLSEILLEDLPSDSLEYGNVQEILRAGKRGKDLIKQILSFSRQTEHKMIPVRVQKVLKEALKLSRSSIPSDIAIASNIQIDCGLVLADPTQVHQIAMNLITNAYHAVEQTGGKISIQLKETEIKRDNPASASLKPGKHAVFSISDTGCGIEPALKDKVFDPYFTTKHQDKGTGLGLAMVFGIVKEHKGHIDFSSEVDTGTTFTVYLPLMEKTSEIISAETPGLHPIGNERILLVDDEEPIVLLEKQILERLGYTVETRYSSVDALKAFKANPGAIDLVITDMTMPNMTGDKLAMELISIRSDIPVIICTGFSERIDRNKAEAAHIKGFLMKPIVKSELAQMVRKVLDEMMEAEGKK